MKNQVKRMGRPGIGEDRVRKVYALADAGKAPKEIAAEVCCSVSLVYRILQFRPVSQDGAA